MNLIDLAVRRLIHVDPDSRHPWRQALVVAADEDGSAAARTSLSGSALANELERWISFW